MKVFCIKILDYICDNKINNIKNYYLSVKIKYGNEERVTTNKKIINNKIKFNEYLIFQYDKDITSFVIGFINEESWCIDDLQFEKEIDISNINSKCNKMCLENLKISYGIANMSECFNDIIDESGDDESRDDESEKEELIDESRDDESGDDKSGDDESGDDESEDDESGDDESGYDKSGDEESEEDSDDESYYLKEELTVEYWKNKYTIVLNQIKGYIPSIYIKYDQNIYYRPTKSVLYIIKNGEKLYNKNQLVMTYSYSINNFINIYIVYYIRNIYDYIYNIFS